MVTVLRGSLTTVFLQGVGIEMVLKTKLLPSSPLPISLFRLLFSSLSTLSPPLFCHYPLFFPPFLSSPIFSLSSTRLSSCNKSCTHCGSGREEGGRCCPFTLHIVVFFRAVYQSYVRVLSSLAGLRGSRWTEFLGPYTSPNGSWWFLYKLLIEKIKRRPLVEGCTWGYSHKQIQSTI